MSPGDHEERIRGVTVVRWNPIRSDALGRARAVSNFGDLLGPMLIEHLVPREAAHAASRSRLVALGSVMHFARDGDVVWGTGVNGKVPVGKITARSLDIRAVRGPRTREILQDLGMDVPEVYGDPALLLPEVFPELAARARRKCAGVSIVPNLNDVWTSQYTTGDPRILSPTGEVHAVLTRIVESLFVVGSSLHGVIVAEAFGVPARFVKSSEEDVFKYNDYLLSTARDVSEIADSVDDALARGPMPPPQIDLDPLRNAFPLDLWVS